MAELPGSVGWPLLGDKSIDFYKDPVKFVEKYMAQNKSRVFASRFLNKPTVFVCSNQGVSDVLADRDNAFELGYKAYMGQIFGDNILFTDGDEAYMFRDALSHLFTPEAVQSYQEAVQRIAKNHVANIDPKKPLCLYTFFKRAVTEICLTLFLGLDFAEAEEAANVISLTLKHWHGIVSVPLQVKLPGTSSESAFGKAMSAKKELLKIIREQRGKAPEGFVRRMQEVASAEEDVFINNHLLLFTSALVPKAIGSMLTTFAIEAARPEMVSVQPELLTNKKLRADMFREVHRMFPPFLGGRRVATKDTVIDGYKVPAEFAVVYMTGAAQRDPAVFPDPDRFRHERWSADKGVSEDNLFGFGHGPRRCIGQQVVWNIINEVLTQLLLCYNWTLQDKQDFMRKHLPVSRPKGAIMVNLIPVDGGIERDSSSSRTSVVNVPDYSESTESSVSDSLFNGMS